MKTLKVRSALMAIAIVLTLGLSQLVAQATGCVDRMVGGNAYGDYDCTLVGSCGGSCYYSCKCSNVFFGYTCDDVLQEAGFEKVDSPSCIH